MTDPFADLLPPADFSDVVGGGPSAKAFDRSDPFADLLPPADFSDVVGGGPSAKAFDRSDPFADLYTPRPLMSDGMPERTGMEAVSDAATRVRQGLNSVVGGIVAAPVNISNMLITPPHQRALNKALGIPTEDIDQPDFVRGIQESLSVDNELEGQGLSDKAKMQAEQFQNKEGFVDAAKYLLENPSYLATEGAAQIPQFLQLVPGSVVGTVGAQAAGAASQNVQQIEEELRRRGVPEAEIKDRAADAFAQSMVINSALPMLPGGSSFDRLLAGRAEQVVGTGATRFLKPLMGETVTEGLQESGDQVIQNIAQGDDIGQGVGQAAALGTLMGTTTGGIAGGVDLARGDANAGLRQAAALTGQLERDANRIRTPESDAVDAGREAARAIFAEADADVRPDPATIDFTQPVFENREAAIQAERNTAVPIPERKPEKIVQTRLAELEAKPEPTLFEREEMALLQEGKPFDRQALLADLEYAPEPELIRNGTRVFYPGDVKAMRAKLAEAGLSEGMRMTGEDGSDVGLYFPAKMQAEVDAVLRPKPAEQAQPEPVKEGELPYRELGIPPPRKPRNRVKSAADFDPNYHDIRDFIALNGGLDAKAFAAEFNSEVPSPAENFRFFGKPLFRKSGGLQPDQLRELLQETGFLNPDSMDGVARYTPQDAYDLVDRALDGNPVYHPDGVATQNAIQNYNNEYADLSRRQEYIDEHGATPELDEEFARRADAMDRGDFEPVFSKRAKDRTATQDMFGATQRAQTTPTPRPVSGDLFGAPTSRERLDAAQRDSDARLTGPAVGMRQGDGELFAGTRPEQKVLRSQRPDTQGIEVDEATPTPEEMAAFNRQVDTRRPQAETLRNDSQRLPADTGFVRRPADGTATPERVGMVSARGDSNRQAPARQVSPAADAQPDLTGLPPKFGDWFRSSKMKDEAAKPMEFHHATDADFEAFDPGRRGSATGFAPAGLGNWFSRDSGALSRYGSKLLSGHLRLENPKVMDSHELPDLDTKADYEALAKQYKDEGYDGLYFPDSKQAVAFDSVQFKEKRNSGEYSESPNIFKSESPKSAKSKTARLTADQIKAAKADTESRVASHWGRSAVNKLKTRGRVEFITKQEVVDRGLQTMAELDGVDGFFDPESGKAYVIADSGAQSADLPGVLSHEVFHANAEQFLGSDGFKRLKEAFRKLKNRDKDIAAAYKRVPSDTSAAHVDEEGIAYLAQEAPKHRLSERLTDEAKLFLNRLGIPLDWLNAHAAAVRKIAALNLKDAANRGGVMRFGKDGPLASKRVDDTAQTKTESFKRWSGGAPVFKPDEIISDYEGGPAVFELYHGTTADFDTFSNDRANPESDMGAGFYFSNTPDDVGSNYAGLGPDLTNKIEREAERIAGETDREYNDPDVVAEARSKFMNNDGATLPVFVRTKNPAILGGEHETRLTYEESYDKETDEYGEPEGTLVDFIGNLREAASNFNDGDVEAAIASLENGVDGDVALSDVLKTLKDSEEFNYYTDDEGNMVSNEVVRQALEWSGFDSVIDFTVDEKFGSQKRVGKPMKGMTADTVHVIAFKPNQIKSSIGNSGAFSDTNPSILASKRTRQDAEKDAEPTPRFNSATEFWTDNIGKPLFNTISRATKAVIANDFLKRHGLNLAEDMPPEAQKAWRAYKQDVGNLKKTVSEIADEAKNLSPEERAMVSDLVEREMKAGVTPPEAVVRMATLMTSIMRKQSQQLVETGMLSKDAADRWEGRYLPRFYQKHLLTNPFDAMLRKAYLSGIKGTHLKGRGLFETIPVEDVPAYEKMGWEVRDPEHGKKPSLKGLPEGSKVRVWRDFTPAERQKMGEVRDAMYRFARGYTDTQIDIAKGKLFDHIARTVARDDNPGGSYVLVPDTSVPGTGVKKFGNLAGKYVPGDVLSALKTKAGPDSDITRAYLKALSLWKEGKTSLNPVTHVNNVVSNLVMADLAGVNLVDPRSWKLYADTFNDYRKEGTWFKEAQKAGLFGGEWYGNEVAQWLPLPSELKDSGPRSIPGKFAMKTANALGAVRRGMGNLYRAEDQFFKLLLYKQARERGLEPNDAVTWAERFVFDYSTAAPGVTKLKNTLFPFANYSSKAVPALTFAATHYPWRIAKWLGLLSAFSLYSFNTLYGDDDEDMADSEAAMLPDYLKGRSSFFGVPKAIRLPYNDESTGDGMYVDISRFVPLGDLFDAENQSGGVPLPAPLTPNNPIITTAIAMLANKDSFTGKDIVRESDTGGEAAQKRIGWLYRQMAPNNPLVPGSYNFNRIGQAVSAMAGEPIGPYTGLDYNGNTISPGRALAQTFGIKLRSVDFEKEMDFQIYDLKREISDLKGQKTKLKKNQSISDETLEKELDKLDAKIESVQTRLYDLQDIPIPQR